MYFIWIIMVFFLVWGNICDLSVLFQCAIFFKRDELGWALVCWLRCVCPVSKDLIHFPATVPDTSFLLMQALAENENASVCVPAAHGADLDCGPGS